ncbi:hypothetical protein H2201_000217 [Coniosporium apollinis]|uniref:Signal recognition particle receptor subunit beta n=1 Tax=Coniosporium apollinis TaxID=61459 RepID=A0ABQ9P989_9PEZI|nr:hypothetical protein H2201_000217 [Coniosporium apollinis]
MAWHDADSWLSRSFGPYLSTILLAAFVSVALPLLLHLYIYRKTAPTSLPAFLLIGPSGAGKTSLLTLLERGNPSPTHTSQAPLSVEVTLPSDTTAASNKYRSASDPTAQKNSRFLLIDTPGHGKLRHFASAQLVAPQNLKGIIYLVDAANLSSDSAGVSGSNSSGLTEAAEYLHDILLALQKRYTNAKTSKGPRETPVLIAANKMDLFTALPAPLVKAALEAEITRVRDTRAKGLLDSGIGMDEDGDREEKDWLGDGGEGKFTFKQMEEVNVMVEVKGGNVVGGQGGEVGEWWEWIGRQL